jgi:hypothetical protein
VRPILCPIVFLLALNVHARAAQEVQSDSVPKKPDAFFAGNVVDVTFERVTISRVVLGNAQRRVFRITPDTKVEGDLRMKVRVTVRYEPKEDGDVALQIIVRSSKAK